MRKNEFFNVKNLTRLAFVAAMYAVLTIVIQPIGYGDLQCRVSEVLVLLCFYRRDYTLSLMVGCFIANLFSPLGVIDWILGPVATGIAAVLMFNMKNIYLAALLPVLSNGIIVGTELTVVLGKPIWWNMLSVALGEFVAVGILGTVLFKLAFEKNHHLMKLIGSTRKTSGNNRAAKV